MKKKLLILAIVSYLVLHLFDAVFTYIALSNGGVELNPIASKMFEIFGLIPGMVITSVLVVGSAYLCIKTFPKVKAFWQNVFIGIYSGISVGKLLIVVNGYMLLAVL